MEKGESVIPLVLVLSFTQFLVSQQCQGSGTLQKLEMLE